MAKEKIVFGLFDDMSSAQRAVQALEAQGFARQFIDIRSAGQITTGAQHADDSGDGFWASIKHFFSGTSSEGQSWNEGGRGMNESDVLVTVHCDDRRAETAADILDAHGAQDIDQRMSGSGASGDAAPRGATATGASVSSGDEIGAAGADERKIPVVEENLRVGKREGGAGGVRVRSRIIERPVEQEVTLREENVQVQRQPVDQPLGAAGEGAFKEQAFEVRATNEEPVVEKQTRVKEEVSVKKETRQRKQKVQDKLRATDVQVEPLTPEEEGEFSSHAREFQSDWQSKYAGRSGLKYEDVEPGYQYGYRLGRNAQYGDADWPAIEPKVKNDWNQHGYGPWEQFKDAVRSGWERAHRS